MPMLHVPVARFTSSGLSTFRLCSGLDEILSDLGHDQTDRLESPSAAQVPAQRKAEDKAAKSFIFDLLWMLCR
jgi:hypothetical protein